MRITSGHYKNRTLFVPEGRDIRPTSDRMRQSLLNLLRHAKWLDGFALDGARVADLFCGTGALGLEMLSNGASHVTFMDQNIQTVEKNTGFLAPSLFRIVQSDIEALPPGKGEIDLVLMDPPYRQGLADLALTLLIAQNWLSDGALIVTETERGYQFETNPALTLLDHRVQSQSQLHVFRYKL